MCRSVADGGLGKNGGLPVYLGCGSRKHDGFVPHTNPRAMTRANLSLSSYRLLGRSGLRVSPFALGAMTFGADWGWGADEAEARRMFDAYVSRGGNFIDTANNYTQGSSERLVGQFAEGKREQLVLATKYSMATRPGDPNSGGNQRKSMVRSVEESLRRLRTDYIDLLYLHMWDSMTPVEEILRGMDDLVRQGKVLYLGISDTPAWQVSRMHAIADLRGWAPLIAMESEYSLVERTAERELIPMAQEVGIGVISWSPLANGVLSGKYSRADLTGNSQTGLHGTRKAVAAAVGSLSERSLGIADEVAKVAADTGHSSAQIALAWTLVNPGVTATLLGARTAKQLESNLGALDVTLSDEHLARLDKASAIELGFPHNLLSQPMTVGAITGGTQLPVRTW
jgi:aryl-alcohol dehydrogenase-like predicted oxidoreductase